MGVGHSRLHFVCISVVLFVDYVLPESIIKSATLTPSNVTMNGANVGINSNEVHIHHGHYWNATVIYENTWQFILSLNNQWGFQPTEPSTIRITINSSYKGTTEPFNDLLFGFTVDNAQFFSIWIPMRSVGGTKNKIYPNCDTKSPPTQSFANGDIASVPNTDRSCDIAGGDCTQWNIMRPNTVNPENEFPLTFTLTNDPLQNTLTVLYESSSFVSQTCGFVALPPNHGLKVYIGGDVPGQSFVIESMSVQYLAAVTSAPTVHLSNTNSPSSVPTDGPTFITTDYPLPSPTPYPTDKPTSAPSKATLSPSSTLSNEPSPTPTQVPSVTPTFHPTTNPSLQPSKHTTNIPTVYPSEMPTFAVYTNATIMSLVTSLSPTHSLPANTIDAALSSSSTEHTATTVDIPSSSDDPVSTTRAESTQSPFGSTKTFVTKTFTVTNIATLHTIENAPKSEHNRVTFRELIVPAILGIVTGLCALCCVVIGAIKQYQALKQPKNERDIDGDTSREVVSRTRLRVQTASSFNSRDCRVQNQTYGIEKEVIYESIQKNPLHDQLMASDKHMMIEQYEALALREDTSDNSCSDSNKYSMDTDDAMIEKPAIHNYSTNELESQFHCNTNDTRMEMEEKQSVLETIRDTSRSEYQEISIGMSQIRKRKTTFSDSAQLETIIKTGETPCNNWNTKGVGVDYLDDSSDS